MKTNKVMVRLGNAVRDKRMKLNMGQQDLADKAGSTQSEVSRFERGEANVTLQTLCRYCKILRLKIRLVSIKEE